MVCRGGMTGRGRGGMAERGRGEVARWVGRVCVLIVLKVLTAVVQREHLIL